MLAAAFTTACLINEAKAQSVWVLERPVFNSIGVGMYYEGALIHDWDANGGIFQVGFRSLGCPGSRGQTVTWKWKFQINVAQLRADQNFSVAIETHLEPQGPLPCPTVEVVHFTTIPGGGFEELGATPGPAITKAIVIPRSAIGMPNPTFELQFGVDGPAGAGYEQRLLYRYHLANASE